MWSLRRIVASCIRVVQARPAIDKGFKISSVRNLIDVVVGIMSVPFTAFVVDEFQLGIR